MEKYCACLKDNRVGQIAVFESENQELADFVAQDTGYDEAMWVNESKPAIWSTYDGSAFTAPTNEYLISIGNMIPPVVEETPSE